MSAPAPRYWRVWWVCRMWICRSMNRWSKQCSVRVCWCCHSRKPICCISAIRFLSRGNRKTIWNLSCCSLFLRCDHWWQGCCCASLLCCAICNTRCFVCWISCGMPVATGVQSSASREKNIASVWKKCCSVCVKPIRPLRRFKLGWMNWLRN